MALTIEQIEAMAPILRIHPQETFWPMDPMEFIKQSRFRHHRGLGADAGYNKKIRKWVEGVSDAPEYADIPVDFIDSYGLWKKKYNRRPRDSNSGGHWNVFLEAKGSLAGISDPNARIPVFYFQHAVDTSNTPAEARKQLNIKVEQYVRVSYWWFMGYNEAPLKFDHQGDWEHVTLKIVKEKVAAAHFARHQESVTFIPLDQLAMSGGRVVAYCARGTHASYPRAGQFDLPLGYKDLAADGGYDWDTSRNLLALQSQPWRDYAGAWGKVGELSETTGPLGPWHKRHKA